MWVCIILVHVCMCDSMYADTWRVTIFSMYKMKTLPTLSFRRAQKICILSIGFRRAQKNNFHISVSSESKRKLFLFYEEEDFCFSF
jgi:hypothetical protein